MTGRMLPLVIEIRSEADVAAALEVLRSKAGAKRAVVRPADGALIHL
jgi:hypothetical protein